MSGISDLMLERYLLNEVTDTERETVNKAVLDDRTVQERIALVQSESVVLRPAFAKKNRANRGAQVQRKKIFFAAAALVLCVAIPSYNIITHSDLPSNSGAQPDRMKGTVNAAPITANLSVYLKTGDHDGELIDQNTVLHEGDTIQIAYNVSGGGENVLYGVMFSFDGNNVVTKHFPDSINNNDNNDSNDSRLQTGKNIFLPQAYTLDDAPNYEKFFFLVSDKPLDAAYILSRAADIALKESFDACVVEKLVIKKGIKEK